MMDLSCGVEDFAPIKKLTSYIKYKRQFRQEHPHYFYADGLVVFCGAQGTGKTLSAVNYVYNLIKKYPHAKLCTNILLNDYKIYTFEDYLIDNYDEITVHQILEKRVSEDEYKYYFNLYVAENHVFPFENCDDLGRYNNGENGVIFLIDEIQLYLNSLESKNINMEVMVQISQQRKQRKHIVCTSQVFGRLAKPLREQFSVVCLCKNYFGFLQVNKVVDRDSIDEDNTDDSHVVGKVKRKYFYIHTPDYYNRYDTYYTISKNKFVSNEMKKGDIYGNTINTTDN